MINRKIYLLLIILLFAQVIHAQEAKRKGFGFKYFEIGNGLSFEHSDKMVGSAYQPNLGIHFCLNEKWNLALTGVHTQFSDAQYPGTYWAKATSGWFSSPGFEYTIDHSFFTASILLGRSFNASKYLSFDLYGGPSIVEAFTPINFRKGSSSERKYIEYDIKDRNSLGFTVQAGLRLATRSFISINSGYYLNLNGVASHSGIYLGFLIQNRRRTGNN